MRVTVHNRSMHEAMACPEANFGASEPLTAPTDAVLFSQSRFLPWEPHYAHPEHSREDRPRESPAEAPAGTAGTCPNPRRSCTCGPRRGSGLAAKGALSRSQLILNSVSEC